MSKAIDIFLHQEDEGITLSFLTSGGCRAKVTRPFRVCPLGYPAFEGQYTSVRQESSALMASATVTASDGTTLAVTDTWQVVDEGTVQVDRRVVVESSGDSQGIRVEFCAETAFADTSSLDDFEFFIPGSLYKKNDTDHDGVEDYLGTYVQDYRDDRLASLAVLAYVPAQKEFVALSRATVPQFDTAISSDSMLQRHFVQSTDIGSLGLAPCQASQGQIEFRASYPFMEEYTFCLNINRDGWAAYLPNRAGTSMSISYQLHFGTANTLTDAIWTITQRQMATLGTAPQKPCFTLEDALDHRVQLTQSYYREWTRAENPKEPAGYMVHFSPRSGKTLGTLLEYGFSGGQTLLAYTSLKYGYLKNNPTYIARARRVIDFFVGHCQLENGFSHGIYDVAKQNFVYWFTGVLMPFQYASDEESLKRYLGSQVTSALMPVAEQLRTIQGNYTRTMCESIYSILLAYRVEQSNGYSQTRWLAAAERFGDFLLRTQEADGSWYRAYSVDGAGLDDPAQWFGASEIEKKSGTIFPVEVLVELYTITGDTKYLTAAERAGFFIFDNYIDPVEYVGGLNDTTHIKSVKIDSVGVMFVMRSCLKLYEASGNSFFLDAAERAAKILASWVYLWNVPFPENTLLADSEFRSIGWVACDVIPGGSYLDNEFLEFTGDLVRIAQHSGNRTLFDLAEMVEYGMHHTLSMPGHMLGYVKPGIQCEGIMTAYWMSDPDRTEFSGAVNKVKGQDNDTCNGLTNGQAAYALYELLDGFDTIDFADIRNQIFGE